jgi:hypothetical protein
MQLCVYKLYYTDLTETLTFFVDLAMSALVMNLLSQVADEPALFAQNHWALALNVRYLYRH